MLDGAAITRVLLDSGDEHRLRQVIQSHPPSRGAGPQAVVLALALELGMDPGTFGALPGTSRVLQIYGTIYSDLPGGEAEAHVKFNPIIRGDRKLQR